MLINRNYFKNALSIRGASTRGLPRIMLNKCKPIILRYILSCIKSGQISSYKNSSIFEKLQSVNWRELDIIRQSLDGVGPLNETVDLNSKTEAQQIAAINRNKTGENIRFIKIQLNKCN